MGVGDVTDVDERVAWIEETVLRRLQRRGAVVQTSGGIDSAVTLMLCARAFPAEQVVSLFLPDRATGPETQAYAEEVAAAAGVPLTVRSIAASIEAQQDPAVIHDLVASYFEGFDPETQAYAVNTSHRLSRRLGAPVYELTVGPRHGEAEASRPLRADDLRQIIAFQNRKQRTRMVAAYAEAEARDLAVVGASNRDELATGFVVKYGDDAADLCAIGDVAKDGVYALAEALGVPASVRERRPTTDTFALVQGQDDYYYSLPASAIERLVAAGDDDAVLEEVAQANPSWTPAALRQMRGAFEASVRYNTTRSLVKGAEGTA